MNNFIEKVSKILPFLSLIILLSSIIKNYTYYFNFGININEYIDLSEFPLLFINDFSFYLFFLLSFLIYFPLIYLRIYIRNRFGAQYFTFTLTKKISKFAIPIIILTIIYICFKDTSLDIKLSSIENYIVIFFVTLLFYLDKDLKFSKNYYFIVASFLMILFSMFSAFSEISKIEQGKIHFQVSFIFDNKELKTNNTQIYLGKTKNYIYIYDKKLKETSIYNFEELKNFKIKKL